MEGELDDHQESKRFGTVRAAKVVVQAKLSKSLDKQTERGSIYLGSWYRIEVWGQRLYGLARSADHRATVLNLGKGDSDLARGHIF